TDNTIVVFLSDNGGAKNNGSINLPLRAQKGSLYDGGIRVPFAMCWPAKIPAGKDYDQPISSLDIFATTVAHAGLEKQLVNPLDGVDLIPYLSGQKKGSPHDYLFWRKSGNRAKAVRAIDHKLVQDGTEDWTLFQVTEDIGEQNDLSAQQKRKVKSLNRKYENWTRQLMGPIFMGLLENKAYDQLHPDRFKRPKSNGTD
ncbi:MAG: sulfatase-like hydrolase/transferase, partial [Bacteroidota bacterium]